jgi:hypothetical protein
MQPTAPTCQGFKKNGDPCQSPATDATGMCYWHSERVSAEDRRAAAQKGALVMHQRQALPAVADVRMGTPEGCLQLLQQTVEEMKTGQLDTRTGNAVSYAVGTACKIWEVMLSDRIDKLERLVHGRARRR